METRGIHSGTYKVFLGPEAYVELSMCEILETISVMDEDSRTEFIKINNLCNIDNKENAFALRIKDGVEEQVAFFEKIEK